MTSPPFACLRIILTAACVIKNCPFTNTSYNRSQSFSVWSSIDLEMERPAELTTISTPPNTNAVDSNASTILARSVMLNTTAWTASLPNFSINSKRVFSNRSLSKSVSTTHAPSSAYFFATAFPIPPALPVTKATLPESSFGLGIRKSFASSRSQYSISKASW